VFFQGMVNIHQALVSLIVVEKSLPSEAAPAGPKAGQRAQQQDEIECAGIFHQRPPFIGAPSRPRHKLPFLFLPRGSAPPNTRIYHRGRKTWISPSHAPVSCMRHPSMTGFIEYLTPKASSQHSILYITPQWYSSITPIWVIPL